MAALPTAMTTAPRTSKRKRNEVSYDMNNALDYLDDLDDGDSEDADVVVESESELDYEDFRPGKKPRKAPVKKKSKSSAKKLKPLKQQKPFRFMDLPPELRDEIYEVALTDPNGVSLVSRTKNMRRTIVRDIITTQSDDYYKGKKLRNYRRWYAPRPAKPTTQEGTKSSMLVPNLLAVNKQIREEASGILYRQEIMVEDTTALLSFIASIGPHNRALLSEVTVKGWGEGRGVQKGNNFAALSMLSTCVNLKSLFFDCSIGWNNQPVKLARQIYRDGHYFLEAFGAANGAPDAAVDILEISDWCLDKNRDDTRYARRRQSGIEPELDEKKQEQFENELRRLLTA